MDALKGYKTYLVAAGVALTVGLQAAGFITQDIAEVFYGLLGASGLATIAAKINRVA
jgi:hypothetical protein